MKKKLEIKDVRRKRGSVKTNIKAGMVDHEHIGQFNFKVEING